MISFALGVWIFVNPFVTYWGPIEIIQCPPSDLQPANCKCQVQDLFDTVSTLAIHCQSFRTPQELSEQILLYKHYNVSELWISHSSLSHIPSGVFTYFGHLSRFSLHNVSLETLSVHDEDVFAGLENSLRWFYLESSGFSRNFNWALLHNLRSLSIIHIFHSELATSRNMDTLASLPMKEFYIWGTTGLSFIGDTETLSRNENLTEFGLRRVGLSTIKRNLLPRPATKLVTIEICQNPIASLPDDLFHDMPSLRNLDLTGNQILTFQPEMFRPILTHIQSLRLGDYQFACENGELWFLKLTTDARLYKYEGVQCFIPKSP